MRARYRNGLENQELMKEGEIYKITVPMDSTGVTFKHGHKIRLSITSSEFPRYARNNNTGNPVNIDSEIKIALNSIHHGKTYPSRILLPVI
jgi:putative CocE/NonD family hydrolase